MHDRNIIHRDLKPENILLAKDEENCFDVKIVDFGLSAEFSWKHRETDRAGTLLYMAPEQVTKKGYSKKIDIWSCGIIQYKLLTCEHPCFKKGDSDSDYLKMLQNVETNPIQWKFPSYFSPLAKDFFLKLCSFPATRRYDAQTALQHPWITRNRNDSIPLTAKQEILMFETERGLRKVMRMAYFLSQVKLNDASRFQERQPQKKRKSPKKQIAIDRVSPPGNTEKTISNSEEGSPLLPFKRLPSTFLTNDFLEYKQRLMKESQKSLDSTSADSKRQKSEARSDGEEDGPNNQSQTSRDALLNNNMSTGNFGRTWSVKKQQKKTTSKRKKGQKLNSLQPDLGSQH